MEEDRLLDIVDALVLKEGSEIEIRVVANLARRCLNLNGRNRPTMREVTAELEALQMAEKSSNAQQIMKVWNLSNINLLSNGVLFQAQQEQDGQLGIVMVMIQLRLCSNFHNYL
ncbi:wall-associated receptor kinase-like 1 [Prunus yedoensis var. nudiflora]|uniref:Wall-associated receptor kinase-like 1 n=1 Tax=Prunus yedoensis var. nudiflora TaxID=2094558 RepID=A0A314XK22_PRUYE|nr:wall-associated receptor kinase-like 1 [Prunus yedoensis var. nudiflora]